MLEERQGNLVKTDSQKNEDCEIRGALRGKIPD